MNPLPTAHSLETLLVQWQDWLRSLDAVDPLDATRRREAVRDEALRLVASGLAGDEAFLLTLRRRSAQDDHARAFLASRPEWLWQGQEPAIEEPGTSGRALPRDALVAFGLAVIAALCVKLPQLLGFDPDLATGVHLRWGAVAVPALLCGYFAWKRSLDTALVVRLALAIAALGAFALAWPFVPQGNTEVLATLHLPVALWLAVGIAYAGAGWGGPQGRMAFIRFSGALFILYVLIALGGGVLTAFVLLVFDTIGMTAEDFVAYWLLPCGAAGAVLVAAWLVEARQGLVAQVAPVLTRLFAPLFTLLMLAFLAALLVTGRGLDAGREVLIAFDLVLVVVLGLFLFAVSARDPRQAPGAFDVLLLVLLLSALLADVLVLWAIAARIGEFGFTPNRVAGLGLNLVLGVNLAVSAVLCFRFQRGVGTFAAIERWQTAYLPVFAVWAAVVIVVFPPLFGFR